MSQGVQVSTLKTAGEGAYRVAAVSGLLSGVAAASASAGHLFAAQWAPAAASKIQFCVLQRLRARLVTIAGYTAAQEIGIDLSIARSFTVAGSSGTALTLTGDNNNKRSSFPASAFADMRVANTSALTAGTQTLDAQPIAQGVYAELAAAATVPKGAAEIYLSTEDLDRYPVVLAPNEGLIVRNTIAQGAGGTGRLIVEMDWLEVVRY
jgi:hypothetical protein